MTESVNQTALAGFIGEIEHQLDERKVITETLRGIYDRAEKAGFVPAFLRTIVKERQMAKDDRHARYATLDAYRRALGMLDGTPLGEAAMTRAETEVNGTAAARPMDRLTDPPSTDWPRPFAAQLVHEPKRRGRPRQARPVLFDAAHPQGAP